MLHQVWKQMYRSTYIPSNHSSKQMQARGWAEKLQKLTTLNSKSHATMTLKHLQSSFTNGSEHKLDQSQPGHTCPP